MAVNKRGYIRNLEFFAQPQNFSGLRFGNCTPTDIDALLEFQGKAFVIIEAKFGTAKPPKGQLIALERLTDSLTKGGQKTLLILGSHNGKSSESIDFAAMTVTRYRSNYKWRDGNLMKCRELIDIFLKQHKLVKL